MTMRFGAVGLASLFVVACGGNTLSKEEMAKHAFAIFSVSHDNYAEKCMGSTVAYAMVYLDPGFMNPGAMYTSRLCIMAPPKWNSDFPDRKGHLFVADLDPGQHEFTWWQVYNAGMRIVGKPAPLRFEVKAGDVVYLGNLHAHLAYAQTFIGETVSNAMVEVMDRSDQDIQVALKEEPALAGRIRKQLLPLGPWIEPEGPSRNFDPLPLPVPLKK